MAKNERVKKLDFGLARKWESVGENLLPYTSGLAKKSLNFACMLPQMRRRRQGFHAANAGCNKAT